MDLHPAIAFGSADRRRRRAGRGGRGPGHSGCGHGASCAQQRRRAARGDRQPPHQHGARQTVHHVGRGRDVSRPAAPMATPEAFVPVAIARRSDCDESVHFGAVVGLASNGEIEFAVGDPTTAIYPRSSNKPMQAVAMVRAGLQLPPDLLALVCASHDGTPTAPRRRSTHPGECRAATRICWPTRPTSPSTKPPPRPCCATAEGAPRCR